MNRVFYFDMDGVIANFHKEPYKYANAINRQWIANLEPFMENISVMANLIENGDMVYVLTKAASENARLGKIDFLMRYLPQFDIENRFICIVGSGKKVDYIKEDGILIDDDMKNIRQWEKGGHSYYYVEIKGQRVEL